MDRRDVWDEQGIIKNPETRTPRTGWGRSLWKFYPIVRQVLAPLEARGLWINQVTWVANDESCAEAVALWKKLQSECFGWQIVLGFIWQKDGQHMCRLRIFNDGGYHFGREVLLEYVCTETTYTCLSDRRLDLLLEGCKHD